MPSPYVNPNDYLSPLLGGFRVGGELTDDEGNPLVAPTDPLPPNQQEKPSRPPSNTLPPNVPWRPNTGGLGPNVGGGIIQPEQDIIQQLLAGQPGSTGGAVPATEELYAGLPTNAGDAGNAPGVGDVTGANASLMGAFGSIPAMVPGTPMGLGTALGALGQAVGYGLSSQFGLTNAQGQPVSFAPNNVFGVLTPNVIAALFGHLTNSQTGAPQSSVSPQMGSANNMGAFGGPSGFGMGGFNSLGSLTGLGNQSFQGNEGIFGGLRASDEDPGTSGQADAGIAGAAAQGAAAAAAGEGIAGPEGAEGAGGGPAGGVGGGEGSGEGSGPGDGGAGDGTAMHKGGFVKGNNPKKKGEDVKKTLQEGEFVVARKPAAQYAKHLMMANKQGGFRAMPRGK